MKLGFTPDGRTITVLITDGSQGMTCTGPAKSWYGRTLAKVQAAKHETYEAPVTCCCIRPCRHTRERDEKNESKGELNKCFERQR
jgi:hypothetical protein